MRLFIVRHAESEANERDILASRIDYPLSNAGRAQAEAVARAFIAENRPELVVCSPLKRARQTAEAFARAGGGIPTVVREEITEVHLGRYSGLTYAEIETADGYVHERSARWDWVPDGGGESYAMIAERVEPFFVWLDGRPENAVLVVSHAVTMRLLRAHLEATLPEYPLPIARNGEVWSLDYRGLGRAHEISSRVYDDAVPHRRA